MEDTLAEEVLLGHFREGDTIHVDYIDGKVVFTKGLNLPELPSNEPVVGLSTTTSAN